MHDAVPPGKAGWFLVIDQMTEDKFMAAIEGTNATLVRSNLTEEQEEELKHAFGAKKHKKDEHRLITGDRVRSERRRAGHRQGSPPAVVRPGDQRRPRGAAGRRGWGVRDG